ncbi:ABC transporter ATP-binding protein [Clostridium estertheticum]|uniref:ABC transporter ATP-binding protein n=1 Tax=Clostridium estertheticum TaxID=238834 RepID=UPI0013E97B36|nr:ABC transporter ATP-binding protein [Clostridium estertheticum]MBZ9685014.1 ABC transporter ATP-binding protein [Clostridium estertheticum]
MARLEIRNISKKYEQQYTESFSLVNIDLTVEDGEFLSILGTSGCGKTTILGIITGIIKPDTGSLFVENVDITEMPIEKRNFALVAQQPLLFPNMNVMDNVAFGLKMKGVSKGDRLELANDILSKLGLKGLEKRFSTQLSGGERQRVAIARAMVTAPKVLLMDEPFNALHEELRVDMRELLYKLHKENRVTTIFVTHFKEEANFLSDKIVIMSKGKIDEIKLL